MRCTRLVPALFACTLALWLDQSRAHGQEPATRAAPTEAEFTLGDARELRVRFAAFDREHSRQPDHDAAYRTFIDELLAAVPFPRCQAAALEELAFLIARSKHVPAATARLRTLAAGTDVDAAAAQATLVGLVAASSKGGEQTDGTGDLEREARALAEHPAIDAAVDAGRLRGMFSLLRDREAAIDGIAPQLVAVARHVDEDTSFESLSFGLDAIARAAAAGGIAAADRDAVLDQVARCCEREAERIAESGGRGGARSTRVSYLQQAAEWLRGPAARGTLLGHEAPALEFEWTSGEQGWKSLADLRGKVVVIDFFATWCRPCIAAFPHLRELTARYAGAPVVVLTVTSLQGRHHPKDAAVIRTDGDPAREHELMRSFMREYEMTWPVAFSTVSCFDPRFGVRSIPHVTIIGPDGKVAHNGLSPHQPVEALAAKVDALLRTHGLVEPTDR